MTSKFVQWWRDIPADIKGLFVAFIMALLAERFLRYLQGFGFWAIFGIFLAATVVLLALWRLVNPLFSIDLFIYYRIWLRWLKPQPLLTLRERDIRDSFGYFMPNDKKWQRKRPCLVLRKHLMRKDFWHGQVFSIVAAFNQGSVTMETFIEEEPKTQIGEPERLAWKLSVEVTGEQYGIYNNQGKKFLRERFLSVDDDHIKTAIENRSEEFQSFLAPNQLPGRRLIWNNDGINLPIRWASGGFLPLVWHNNAYWVLLFFRDISPIGLNVPNGASESEGELTEIRRFMAREFSEEIVILNGFLQQQGGLFQPPFQSKGEYFFFINKEFTEEHTKLRAAHDQVFIAPGAHGRTVNLLDTPFQVDVRSGAQHGSKQNVVFTINPAEFGIEAMQLCWFELDDNEYIIDGEYDISRRVLVRRLPMLLRLTRLKEIFDESGSLGEWITPRNELGKSLVRSHDGKLLPEISARDCKVFDADVGLRRKRAASITAGTAKGKNLDWELAHINQWLKRYECAVSKIPKNGLKGEEPASRELRTLCPVTWKTLELGFAHGLFSDLM